MSSIARSWLSWLVWPRTALPNCWSLRSEGSAEVFEQQGGDQSALEGGRRRRGAKVWWLVAHGWPGCTGAEGSVREALRSLPWSGWEVCGVISEDQTLQRDQGAALRRGQGLSCAGGRAREETYSPYQAQSCSSKRREPFHQPPRPRVAALFYPRPVGCSAFV